MDCPEGYEDWYIALEPGPWHTHPDLLPSLYMVEEAEAVKLYIQDVLNDKLVIRLLYKDDELNDAGVWNLTRVSLKEVLVQEQRDILTNERVVFRYWSGKQVAEIKPAISD